MDKSKTLRHYMHIIFPRAYIILSLPLISWPIWKQHKLTFTAYYTYCLSHGLFSLCGSYICCELIVLAEKSSYILYRDPKELLGLFSYITLDHPFFFLLIYVVYTKYCMRVSIAPFFYFIIYTLFFIYCFSLMVTTSCWCCWGNLLRNILIIRLNHQKFKQLVAKLAEP